MDIVTGLTLSKSTVRLYFTLEGGGASETVSKMFFPPPEISKMGNFRRGRRSGKDIMIGFFVPF